MTPIICCVPMADAQDKMVGFTSDGRLVGTLSRADVLRSTMADLLAAGGAATGAQA